MAGQRVICIEEHVLALPTSDHITYIPTYLFATNVDIHAYCCCCCFLMLKKHFVIHCFCCVFLCVAAGLPFMAFFSSNCVCIYVCVCVCGCNSWLLALNGFGRVGV